MKCACAMQTKHLGEMLCLLGEQTSQADYHLVTVNGLLVKLRQAARLWNTAQIVPIVKLKKSSLTHTQETCIRNWYHHQSTHRRHFSVGSLLDTSP